MKHIFGFLDKLVAILGRLPTKLESDSDLREAHRGILFMDEYAQIIERLLKSHKTQTHLSRLHKNNDSVEWQERIQEVFTDIERLLDIVEEDSVKLKRILESDPKALVKRTVRDVDPKTNQPTISEKLKSKWVQAYSDLSMSMMMSGLHDDENVLKELRQMIIMDTDEAKQIINHEEHHHNLKIWFGLEKLSAQERKVQESLFWINLLS